MSVQPTYPGVYVQEVPSGVRTIRGVSTSVAMFIGTSQKGPINKPKRCLNYTSFRDNFGESSLPGDLAQYVKLFFQNNGNDCYVMRIANNPAASSLTIRNEANTHDSLVLTAKDAGTMGENIRAVVSCSAAQPGSAFNLELYILEIQGGRRVKAKREVWRNLSLDLTSSFYAPDFITQNSKLVDAVPASTQAPLIQGRSQSGLPVPHQATAFTFCAAWSALVGNAGTAKNHFLISIDGSPFVEINLNKPVLDVNAIAGDYATRKTLLASAIKNAIKTQFSEQGIPGIDLNVTFETGPNPNPVPAGSTETSLLVFESVNNKDIIVRSASSDDCASLLMLGVENGGLEKSAYANRRPAPNGIVLRASEKPIWQSLCNLQQDELSAVGKGLTMDYFQTPPLTGMTTTLIRFTDLVTNSNTDLFYKDATGGSLNGNNDGIRDKLRKIAARINSMHDEDSLFPWMAEATGLDLTITPADSLNDNFLSSGFANNGFTAVSFLNNVKVYTLGAGGFNIGWQVAGMTGSDGTSPNKNDYGKAYEIIDKEVDLFNIMILPPVTNPFVPVKQLYGEASVFCQKKRAFLLMDPPANWTDPSSALAGLTAIRQGGVVKDYSAIFFPRITVDDNGLKKNIGAAGAIAGLFSRIDSTRGVWKAPAGTEASLTGVMGVEYPLSDKENGTLNPKAINVIRAFPNGIINWGARTMDGDDDFQSEYKYIPVRRLALFMEESLYRGLKWVVFEPNDESLWSQIRLNVGAFMHDLFIQGAFQGVSPKDAYFVKCDKETTTQSDINQGVVNIWVGFAPLKPAEFVILHIQQMAGQINQ